MAKEAKKISSVNKKMGEHVGDLSHVTDSMEKMMTDKISRITEAMEPGKEADAMLIY